MADMFETYPPLPPSPPSQVSFPSNQADRTIPYVRTSFSSGYIRSNSVHELSPIATSPSTPSLRCHSQSRGHKSTKSLGTQSAPPPLPLPKDHIDTGYNSNGENSDARVDVVVRQWRMRRSQSDSRIARGEVERSKSLPSLPENPKIWTPSQLAQYLLTALRFKSKVSGIVSVPKPVAQDIANFVVEYKLNGRAFLRLEDRDIEDMGINQLWRAVLMSSSLELRKSVLKGRIWGFGPEDDDNVFVGSPTPENGLRVPSTVLEREEVNRQDSMLLSHRYTPPFASCDLDTLRSNGYLPQSSSTLGFNYDGFNYTSPHRSTRPRAESASSAASSSAGRVREMVRNLERAASSSEDVTRGNEDAGFASSEFASESDEDSELAIVGNNTIMGYGPGNRSNEGAILQSLSPGSNGAVVIASPSISPSPGASRTSTSRLIKTPPPTSLTNLCTVSHSSHPLALPGSDLSKTKETQDEEPTIEALLQEEEPCKGRPRVTSWGAKAWEEEFPGGTSRRVLASAPISKTSTELLANTKCSQEEMIKVPRSVWDNLCRRLDENERRIALLEMQEAEQRKETRTPGSSSADDQHIPKPSLRGVLSATTLPPYLVIVSVGVCALVAEYVFGRVVGRKPRT